METFYMLLDIYLLIFYKSLIKMMVKYLKRFHLIYFYYFFIIE